MGALSHLNAELFLKNFFMQDLAEEEKIMLEHVPIEYLVADILTKALNKLKSRTF